MPAPAERLHSGLGKFLLLALSVALCITGFLALDFVYSAVVRNRRKPAGAVDSCRVADPVRHHAFRPNCVAVDRWGKDSYSFFTNNLGMRDDRVRQVPPANTKPRILLLGDSFTEGKNPWPDTYAGMIAARLPQYDFLNGGVASYSPSNYLNTTRLALKAGVEPDEVIVFIDISDVSDEAAFYHDIGASGAVGGRAEEKWKHSWYTRLRMKVVKYLLLTNYLSEQAEQRLVALGFYHLPKPEDDNLFDMERGAWTYRQVNEADPWGAGYAPLGVEGGIVKEKAKMDLLWQELHARNAPLSVVVYPWPQQVLHDTADSWQVRLWREWCAGRCKRFVSVFPEFLAAKVQCPTLQPGCWYARYFTFGDYHYNRAGNALVADKVMGSLQSDPPLKIGLQVPYSQARISSQ